MRICEYQQLAMRTSPDGHDRVMNGCLGLIGESGEIVDLVKKWKFQSGDNQPVPKDKLIEECGDVLWYCAELATGLCDSMCSLYERLEEIFYNDMHPINFESSLPSLAVRLMYVALHPFNELHDTELTEEPSDWMITHAKCNIVGIMVMVRDILELYCGSTLEEAMERNIEKLKRRYPDGFDPEKSQHRTE